MFFNEEKKAPNQSPRCGCGKSFWRHAAIKRPVFFEKCMHYIIFCLISSYTYMRLRLGFEAASRDLLPTQVQVLKKHSLSKFILQNHKSLQKCVKMTFEKKQQQRFCFFWPKLKIKKKWRKKNNIILIVAIFF